MEASKASHVNLKLTPLPNGKDHVIHLTHKKQLPVHSIQLWKPQKASYVNLELIHLITTLVNKYISLN